MAKNNIYDEVISDIIMELDSEQSEYQKLHKKTYGITDDKSKNIYKLMTGLCERIRQGILIKERK
jgi:hypothetical protein